MLQLIAIAGETRGAVVVEVAREPIPANEEVVMRLARKRKFDIQNRYVDADVIVIERRYRRKEKREAGIIVGELHRSDEYRVDRAGVAVHLPDPGKLITPYKFFQVRAVLYQQRREERQKAAERRRLAEDKISRERVRRGFLRVSGAGANHSNKCYGREKPHVARPG